MIILAFYGLHRYQLVYLYYKHRKNAAKEPPKHFEQLPRITVQLPIFNEQFVIDRLIESCCNLDYPRELLEIQVLDDSTDETKEVARNIVEQYQSCGSSHRLHPPDGSIWVQSWRARPRPEDCLVESSSPSSTRTSSHHAAG